MGINESLDPSLYTQSVTPQWPGFCHFVMDKTVMTYQSGVYAYSDCSGLVLFLSTVENRSPFAMLCAVCCVLFVYVKRGQRRINVML